MKKASHAVCGLVLLLLAPLGMARPYPEKPVRVIIPFPPGAGPDVRKALLARGLETVSSTPEAFAEYLRADLVKWSRVVKEAHVHVD